MDWIRGVLQIPRHPDLDPVGERIDRITVQARSLHDDLDRQADESRAVQRELRDQMHGIVRALRHQNTPEAGHD